MPLDDASALRDELLEARITLRIAELRLLAAEQFARRLRSCPTALASSRPPGLGVMAFAVVGRRVFSPLGGRPCVRLHRPVSSSPALSVHP
jgi:hypothetical protein